MRTGGARGGITGALVSSLLVTSSPTADAAVDYDALLLWSAVPDAAGYRIYMKRGSGSYDPPVDIGRRAPDADGVVSYELSALALVDRTHFGVTAYDDRGVESDMSNEIELARDVIAANAGPDEGNPNPPASGGDDNRLSIDVPLNGWQKSSGRGSFELANGRLVTDSSSDEKPLEVRYPGSGSLQSQLAEIEFRVRPESASEVGALVRLEGGGWRRLYYRVEDGPVRVRGKRAYVPVGSDTSLRTVRRDLAADVARIFGGSFLHVGHVTVRGSAEVRRVTLRESAENAAAPEADDRVVAVPIADWTPAGATGYGPVADEHTGSVALTSDGRHRPTFPGKRLGKFFAPFERVALLVREPNADFAVHVQVETSLKRRRWLSFEAGDDALSLRASAGSPYQTAHVDLVRGLSSVAAGEELKNIRYIRLSGGFQATGLRLFEPMH